MDDELLEDFLVEAGEILDKLQEQLVSLEQDAEDRDLLNAIFRGFHTIKGGAGFLQILPLVDCCHTAENVFDLLRKGEREVTPELMDVVLQALDAVIAMFAAVREGEPAQPASPALLAALGAFAEPDSAASAHGLAGSGADVASVASSEAENVGTGDDADLEAEFEALLDELHGKPARASAPTAPAAPAAPAGDDLEAEFEALLDELHGKGGKVGAVAQVAAAPAQASEAAMFDARPVAADVEPSLEDQFESLLDELHGKGSRISGRNLALVPSVPAASVAPPAAADHEQSEGSAPVRAAGKAAGKTADKEGRKGEGGDTTVRVDTKVLDEIMNMVGELVLVRNRLVRLGVANTDEDLCKAVGNLDVVTADLQASVMKTRMQPIKKVFGRFPRVVRDLARSLGKEVNLELVGEETDLDKNLVEALADPLVHLVRNAVDHGIEDPAQRAAAGKPRAGRVLLAAEQEGDHIKLTISDDGKGMDAEVLRRKAVEKGLLDEDAAARLSTSECFELIFAPGFSTKDEISDVSGRGVGMDVVKTRITQLNGLIQIQSEPGVGSRLVIKVPLTLAIMPTLMIMLGNQTFALPLASVVEIFNLDLSRTNFVDGKEIVVLRDKPVPLYYLANWLVQDGGGRRDGRGHVVIVSLGTQRVGFVVDQLIGQEEVVIKPLGRMLQGTAGLAGATITGDGRIALILDVPSMVRRYG
jgi:two-component system chemotaxis sensor kinase CheA